MKKWDGYEKGINLGGWLSQCDYSIEHLETFIVEKDIQSLTLWDIDHIRLPIDYEVIEAIEEFDTVEGLKYIDRCISWCQKYHLNLILDLHKVPGFSFDTVPENQLFESIELQNRYVKIWDALARLYGKYHEFVSFELLNEIVEKDSTRWNVLAAETIRVIRQYTEKTYIVVGGIQWNSVHTLNQLRLPSDPLMVYNFHFYEPFLFTHQKAPWLELMPEGIREYPGKLSEYRSLSEQINAFASGLYHPGITVLGREYMTALIKMAIEAATAADVYLYCGEYGVIHTAPPESIVRWYQDIHDVFETYDIGRAAWSYKAMNFGVSDLYQEQIRGSIIRNL